MTCGIAPDYTRKFCIELSDQKIQQRLFKAQTSHSTVSDICKVRERRFLSGKQRFDHEQQQLLLFQARREDFKIREARLNAQRIKIAGDNRRFTGLLRREK